MNNFNHFDWPAPQRTDLMNLSTLRNDYPNKHNRSISQDYKYLPQMPPTYYNKPSFINQCDDIPLKTVNKLNIVRQSLYIDDIPGTKPQIAKFQTKTTRISNPVDPVYQIPTYVTAPPLEPVKFIKDSMMVTDIPGTEIRIKIRQPRRDNPFTEIEGSKPKQLKERANYQSMIDDAAIRKISQRHLDPLQPAYVWEKEPLGNVPGSQATSKHMEKNKIKSQSLNTRDINGAQADTKRVIPKESSKITNNTLDIQNAQSNTVQRGMRTLRQTNPLQPNYQLLGHMELYK